MKIFNGQIFNRLGRFFWHPAITVIPFAIVLWLLIPGIHHRYRTDFVKTQIFDGTINVQYEDFDNDGYSEHYITGVMQGKPFLTLYNDVKCYQQFNLGESYPFRGPSICGDFNNDNKKEIFLFYTTNDSLYVHHINPIENQQKLIGRKFVAIIKDAKTKPWHISTPLLFDLNNDGIKEVIMNVATGFQRTPRRVFAYDIVNDTVFSSPDYGAQGTHLFAFMEKGKARLAVNNYASGNYSNVDTSGIMHDLYSYRIVLDEKLNFRLPIKHAVGDFCGYNTIPFYHNGDTMLLEIIRGSGKGDIWQMNLTDMNGKILKSRYFENHPEKYKTFDVFTDGSGNSKIIGAFSSNYIVLLDHKLEIIKKKKIRTERHWSHYPDLDNDGKPELIFNSMVPGELIILHEDLSSPSKVKVGNNGIIYPISIVHRGKEPSYFMLQIDDIVYFYTYNPLNPLFKYSILAVVYLMIFGFTLMIRRIHLNQLRKKYKAKQTITELKFLSIRNQMEPHFTFNILNTIGSFILQNKPEESYNMLMNYSKLLRTTLNSSDTLLGTLQEEVNFVDNYLVLQKIRFSDIFNYSINIEPHTNLLTIVPKMVIYTYVENSLKHGISSYTGGGFIGISISSDQTHVNICITDNGIGRMKAAEKGSESGKGHNIMHQLYAMLNENSASQITEEILDLVDADGNPAGTEVFLRIPLGIKKG